MGIQQTSKARDSSSLHTASLCPRTSWELQVATKPGPERRMEAEGTEKHHSHETC